MADKKKKTPMKTVQLPHPAVRRTGKKPAKTRQTSSPRG